MKNKKASHVGLVLSFSIFIIFLVFVYIIISDSIIKEDTKKYSLDQLTENVLKELKESVWVIRSYNESTNCLTISMPFSGSNAIVFNSTGELVNSDLSGTTLSLEGTGGFTKIYYSESLENTATFTPETCTETLQKESQIEEKMILEPKIVFLINNVSTNYDLLKEILDVSLAEEFDISFEYQDGTVIGGEKREPNEEIYAQKTEIFYLSSQGLNKKGILRIKIW